MGAYLETDRLTMRYFTADDAELLIELDGDPEVMRFISGEPTPPDVVRDLDLPAILRCYDTWDGDFGVVAAHERDGGAFVGWLYLRPEPGGPRDTVELGYRLRRAAWGRGYATEGSLALLHKGFTELGVHTVTTQTMVANRRSQAVMQKLGMRFTGPLPTPPDMLTVDGADLGGVGYAITKQQWEEDTRCAR